MALFGKSDNQGNLLKRVEERQYKDRSELRELLEKLQEQAGFEARQCLSLLGHRDQEVREFAGQQVLRESGDKGLVDGVLRELEGKNSSVRREIASLAMRLNADRVRAQVGPLLHAKKTEHRDLALELITVDSEWQQHLGLLKVALHDPDTSLRQKAARILARGVESPTIFLILRDLLHEEDVGVRQHAIHALARSGDPEIVEVFLERLPVESEGDRAVMVQALSKLAQDPRSKLEERVVPVLADENADVRDAAVQLLAKMPNRTKVLRAFFLQASGLAYWLRERSTESIMKISQDMVEPLMELLQDPDEEVRVGVLSMAAKCKDPRIVEPVGRILKSGADWWVRSLAADVLSYYPNREVVEQLVAQLSDPEMHYAIIAALGRMENPLVVPHLLAGLEDRERGIRLLALEALRGHDDPTVIEAIGAVAKNDVEGVVRDKAMLELEGRGAAAKDVRAAAIRADQQRQGETEDDVGDLSMENDTLNER
jgi:HEAT repeat protein